MGARLAILTACEARVPDMKNADEVIGLPSGLAQAGGAGVAASLWPVSDLSTMMLMTGFYESWRKGGVNPPMAPRQARIWV
ncbi:MAG: CHAT domain-containing protein, partial [bacterium]|nr:CHAT domain-containing protein [bacterium]